MINKNIFKILFLGTSAMDRMMIITISDVTRRQYQRFHSLIMISGAIRLNTSNTEKNVWVETKQVKWWEEQ